MNDYSECVQYFSIESVRIRPMSVIALLFLHTIVITLQVSYHVLAVTHLLESRTHAPTADDDGGCNFGIGRHRHGSPKRSGLPRGSWRKARGAKRHREMRRTLQSHEHCYSGHSQRARPAFQPPPQLFLILSACWSGCRGPLWCDHCLFVARPSRFMTFRYPIMHLLSWRVDHQITLWRLAPPRSPPPPQEGKRASHRAPRRPRARPARAADS